MSKSTKKTVKSNNGSKWSKQEEAFLRRNMNRMTNKELADALKRPYGGVVWKKQQLTQNTKVDYIKTPISKPKYSPPKQKSFWDKVKEFFS